LAEIDLKLRGKGDLYGIKQHGFERFKLADLEDLKLLEDANSDAQATFAKLADFPQLAQKVHKMYNGPVAEN
ncbi:MAG: ATP-dependent DNA helicase RecG, partial [candidate division WWE3 bacterium GW2011_GWA2_46_9]